MVFVREGLKTLNDVKTFPPKQDCYENGENVSKGKKQPVNGEEIWISGNQFILEKTII